MPYSREETLAGSGIGAQERMRHKRAGQHALLRGERLALGPSATQIINEKDSKNFGKPKQSKKSECFLKC